MNRYAWMVVRMYLPAVVALGVALVTTIATSFFGSTAELNGLAPISMLVALVSGGIATLRMWNWQSGKTPRCAGCGGPLSRVHHAADGAYCTCLACHGRRELGT